MTSARGGGIDLQNAERVDLLELVAASLLRLYPAEADLDVGEVTELRALGLALILRPAPLLRSRR